MSAQIAALSRNRETLCLEQGLHRIALIVTDFDSICVLA